MGARSISDEISMVELSKCFDSEDLVQFQNREKDKDKEKIEKFKEREDRDEGMFKLRNNYITFPILMCLQ